MTNGGKKKKEDITSAVFNCMWNDYENKISEVRDAVIKLEKVIVLKIIDSKWVEHIDMMSKLREGIHLRSYAQDNPLKAYTSEGYEMFEAMLNNIAKEDSRIQWIETLNRCVFVLPRNQKESIRP